MKNVRLGLISGLVLIMLGAAAPGTVPLAAQKEPEVVSLLGRSLYATPATGEELAKLQASLGEAARAVEADPQSVDLIITYGRALAGLWRYHEAIEVFSKGLSIAPQEAMLYRHRGHRYISIRNFDRAASDLAKAAALNDRDFDVWYHLGLAHYLRGEFDKARSAYESCLKVAADDDARVAVSNWLYAALRRLGRDDDATRILEGISEGMKVEENASYFNLLLFFKGLRTEEETLKGAANSELDAATVGYGIGCWHLYSGRTAEARGRFEKIVTGSYWPAFGFIASEAELVRMK